MLPKNLMYQNKIESASASAYTSNIAPQNGTGPYGGGQTIIINVPTRNNLVLCASECTLKFTLQVTNTSGGAAAVVRLDRGGAHGVIQRLRLYSGSNLLEDIDNYGLLMANLISLQASNAAVRGKNNICIGTRNDNFVECNTTGTSGTNVTNGRSYICPGGEKLYTTTEIATFANNGTSLARTYSISLLSILGSLGSQYVPLFGMTSGGPLRLELQLTDAANKFICSDVVLSTFVLTNVEYVASFLELNDNAMAIISNSLGGQPLQYVIPSYRNYVYTQSLPDVGAQINIPIAAKFSSLKSLFTVMRNTANTNNVTFFPHSSASYGLASYNLRVGSKIIPAKAPSNFSEFFIEACKAIGSVSDLNHCPTMNMFSYAAITNTANVETQVLQSKTSCSNNFIIGCDMETYSNADKSSIYSGYNSLNDDIFMQLQLNGTGSAIASLRFDTYALFDALLICENGTAYVKF